MYIHDMFVMHCHTYQVSLLGSDSHSYLLYLTPNISRKMYYYILDLTPGDLILKYYTIGGNWKCHSSACSTLGSYGLERDTVTQHLRQCILRMSRSRGVVSSDKSRPLVLFDLEA